jgi:hypothetical protein
MLRKKYFLIAPLLFLLFQVGFAQNDAFLVGKLIDAKTQEPVVFATVRIKGMAKGVISNEDGGFIIPERFKEMGNSLVISSMGYQRKEIPLSMFKAGTSIKVYLEPAAMQLHETVVTAKRKRRYSASGIVRRAIQNIPNNNPHTLFSTIGYYRDYQKVEGKYVNLNEGIFEVFDQGFSKSDSMTTKTRIYAYHKNTDFSEDTLAQKEYNYVEHKKIIDNAYLRSHGGNEFTILRVHDAIRNHDIKAYSYIYTFDRNLLDNHVFSKGDDTQLDDQNLYTIEFKHDETHYRAYGTLYIAKSDFAIYHLDYVVYNKNKLLPTGQLNKHGNKMVPIFEVNTDYQRFNGKMYLNYISFNNPFLIRLEPKFTTESIIFNLETNQLEIVFNNQPLPYEMEEWKNYEVKINGRSAKIILLNAYKKKVYLKFSEEDVEQFKILFRDLKEKGVDRKELLPKDLISIDIKNIHDLEGNLINEARYMAYDQFREYFVQEVRPKVVLPLNEDMFMKKYKPLFGDQPIFPPEDFKDFWMNTPLKSNINE